MPNISNTAGVAQSVRASGCGSEGRRFNSGHSPQKILLERPEQLTLLLKRYGIKQQSVIGMFGDRIDMSVFDVCSIIFLQYLYKETRDR